MKYRITLNRSYYDYDSVNTRHTPKGDVRRILSVDFEVHSSQFADSRINFHDKTVLNKVLALQSKVVWCYKQTCDDSVTDVIHNLRSKLNFGGADTNHLYWWSIKRV